ncbi:MAG: TRL-like family protein [Candidatus Sumerlaeia bacterium]|nr:TRL-like family protein [Candidatus Sumerlaeia bacterium]
MRKTKFVLLCLFLGIILAGCATPFPWGSLYTKVELPIAATANVGPSTKVGTAECTSVMGLIAIGDASIDAAKKEGGITKIHYVDQDVENILGIIGKYKTVVYGE